jgi:hypothetical protein
VGTKHNAAQRASMVRGWRSQAAVLGFRNVRRKSISAWAAGGSTGVIGCHFPVAGMRRNLAVVKNLARGMLALLMHITELLTT